MSQIPANALTGQTAVVTGASSGIGRAIALRLGRAGAHVLVHARQNRTGAQAVVEEIRSLTGAANGGPAADRADFVLCDLADSSTHQPLVERAWQWRQGIDIWVNNAGVDVLTGAARNWTYEQKLAALWQVDVQATMLLSRLVGERMRGRQAGAIVNIGWDQAEHGMAGASGEIFAAVKGAVMAFSKSLARSLAPQVRVNAVAPGWIKTAWGAEASGYWQERARDESLLARWGTPEDVAEAVAFLASPAAGFITGHILPVNGGLVQSKGRVEPSERNAG